MKKILLPALLGVLLLTGCTERTYPDYPVSHKAYLDYSLGEGYQFSEPDYRMHSDGSRECLQKVTYQNQTLGKQRSFAVQTYSGGSNPFGDQLTSALIQDYWLLDACYQEANAVAMQEFADTILSKYYSKYNNAQTFAERLEMHPKVNVRFSEKAYFQLTAQNVAAISMMEDAVKPGSGLQVCTATLKSLSQDITVIPTFDYTIFEDCEVQPVSNDPAPYLETIEQIYQAYLRAADAPQNYRFTVRRSYSDGNGRHHEELLYDRASLTGVGEFRTAERYGSECGTSKQLGDEKMCAELDEILAKHSGQDSTVSGTQ